MPTDTTEAALEACRRIQNSEFGILNSKLLPSFAIRHSKLIILS
jgi:hypothetical protein